MSPTDLIAFADECGQRFGWRRIDTVRELDISYTRWRRMEDGGRIPRHIALACAAILAGVKPYPETKKARQ